MDAILACVFVTIVFLLGIGSGVSLADLLNENKAKKDGKKPIIRHCMNCQWGEHCLSYVNCRVKYKTISSTKQRKKALFCRFFEKRRR